MRKIILILLVALIPMSLGRAETTSKNMFTSKQIADLKGTGRKIVVPRDLPNGFVVKEVKIESTSPQTPYYSILFTGPQNNCFVVEMGTELGDMIVTDEKGNDVKPTSTISNFALGKASFWDTRYYLGTDWFSSGYKISGDIDRTDFNKDKEIVQLCSKRMEGTEFLRVARSLVVLKN